MDRLTCLASVAFGQARMVLMLLENPVLPVLTPTQRTFAENLSRRIAHDKILDEAFLRDLDAFIVFIQQLVAAGTTICWEADDHNVSGGYEIHFMNDRARALDSVVRELQELWTVIAETLDTAKAAAAALQLVSE